MSEHAARAHARGVIGLIPDACTSCMLCVRECPTWCITLDSHTEHVSEPDARVDGDASAGLAPLTPRRGARPRSISVLDAFSIDYGLCMYCGICVDVCPFDALEWSAQFDYSSMDRAGLVQSIDELAAWLPPS